VTEERPLVPLGEVWVRDTGSLPERAAHDKYLTPPDRVATAIQWLRQIERRYCAQHREPGGLFNEPRDWRILDIGAGEGVWGIGAREVWPNAHIVGVEFRSECRKPGAYDHYWHGDLQDFPRLWPGNAFDLVIGNPPFYLAEESVRAGLHMLNRDGCLMFLLGLNFITSQGRRDGLYFDHPLKALGVWSRRISWTGNGKTNTRDHAMYLWQLGWQGEFSGYLLNEKQSGK
jgi:hypothetical protein